MCFHFYVSSLLYTWRTKVDTEQPPIFALQTFTTARAGWAETRGLELHQGLSWGVRNSTTMSPPLLPSKTPSATKSASEAQSAALEPGTLMWYVCVPSGKLSHYTKSLPLNNYSLKRNKYNLMRKDDLFNQRFWKKMTVHMQKKKKSACLLTYSVNRHEKWITQLIIEFTAMQVLDDKTRRLIDLVFGSECLSIIPKV